MSRIGSLGAAQMVDTVAQTHGPAAANRLMFLQWLRVSAPAVYRLAMQKAMQKVLGATAHAVGPAPLPGVYSSTAGNAGAFGDLSPQYAHARRGRLIFPYHGQGLGDIRPGGDQQRRYQAYEGDGLGALGQDDSSDISAITSADISSIDSSPITDLSSLAVNPIDINIADTSGSPTVNTGSIFSSIISTVSGLASATASLTTALNPAASASLLATNAQRAAQGLPPLNANGTVMSPAQLAASGYSSSQINTWEAALSAQTPTPLIFGLPWYLVAGAAALLYFVLSKKRA